MVVYEVHRAKNDMVMDVSFVNVRREYILMLPLCYRVGKLLSDFMGFLIKMCIRDSRYPERGD